MKYRVLLLMFFVFAAKVFALKSDSIDVLNYEIRLKINFTTYNVSGFTELKIVPKKNNLNSIALDLLKLSVDSVIQNNNNLSYTYNDTTINAILSQSFNTSDTFYIKIYYHGKPVMDPSGFGGYYFSSGYAYNIGVAFQDNPHNYGKVWYPCVDDFIDRATYDFYITVPDTYKAVCGGTLQSIVSNPDTSKTFYWKLNQEIPTYLSSMAAGNYSVITDTFVGINGSIPIELYVRPADTLKTKNSFINLKSALEAYEYYFGPYKWDRVGYVGVPFNGGAMEHATNIAYPNFALNGNLSYQDLMVHELSHHWFGNLITCSTPEDMWINEGWASYCEPLFEEYFYDKQHAKDHLRELHEKNIRYLHIKENGYRAVYGIPHDYTYGSTVYDKGAGVAHSMRGYIGDSLFFPAIKSLLNDYSYKHISSFEMRDYLTNATGIDMNGFFNAYVFSPGYVHCSIDSFISVPDGNNYMVKVYAKTKSRGNNHIAMNNRIDITFIDEDWNKITNVMNFNGEVGVDSFIVSINPKLVIFDLEEKLCDATTDSYKTISTTGLKNFDKTYFVADVVSIVDSAFLRAEHNWVEPDNFKNHHSGIFIAKERYWKIDGIIPVGSKIKGKFYYNKTTSATNGYLDNNLIQNSVDSLVLLYRESSKYDWEIIPFTKSGNTLYGYLITDTLYNGEYTLGIKHYSRLKATIENKSCNNLGKLTAIVEGGIAPYQYFWSNGQTTTEIDNIDNGKYSLTVVDSNSDTIKVSSWLTKYNSISSTIIYPTDISNCNNQINIIAYGGLPPYSYTWNDSLNQSNDTVNLCEGNYLVTITDAVGCQIIDTVNVINSINDNYIENLIHIFPNPTNDLINVITSEDYMLIITDLLGKEILISNTLANRTKTIDCNGVNNGLYLIKFISDKNITSKFFIIKK